MIPIQIDMSGVLSEFDISQDQIKGMITYSMQELTAQVYEKWLDTATRNLKSTRKQYAESLIIGSGVDGQSTFIKLVNDLPNMIEDGADGFDMKEGFSKSSKVKQKKDGVGWYLTIPFRHATPGSLGENEVFSGVLPKEVYKVVKSKEISAPTFKSEGLKKGEIPSPFNIPKTRAAVITESQTFKEYTHKSSIYEGLQKVLKTYERTTQYQYITFRRVSDLSSKGDKGDSWIHPGLTAKHFMEQTLESFTDEKISEVIELSSEEYLEKLFE